MLADVHHITSDINVSQFFLSTEKKIRKLPLILTVQLVAEALLEVSKLLLCSGFASFSKKTPSVAQVKNCYSYLKYSIVLPVSRNFCLCSISYLFPLP